MPTFNVEIARKPNKTGEHAGKWHVYIRVSETVQGKPVHVRQGTGVYITKNDFAKAAKFGRWVKGNPAANDKIEQEFLSVKAAHGIQVNKPILFFHFADRFLEDNKASMNHGTYNQHLFYLSDFRKFAGPGLLFDHINELFIGRLTAYYREKKNTDGTIANKFTTIKKVLKTAGHGDKVYLFDKVKLRYKPGKKEMLTMEEIDLLEKAELIPSERQAADIFLFCLYNWGMRAGDAIKLKVGEIQNGQISYLTRKTSHPFTITMLPQAVRIFEKYASGKGPDEYLFDIILRSMVTVEHDKISNSVSFMDHKLSAIKKRLGITKKITSHVARHTWARLADKSGVDRRIIQKALGHTSLGTTEKYLEDLSADAVDELNKKLFG